MRCIVLHCLHCVSTFAICSEEICHITGNSREAPCKFKVIFAIIYTVHVYRNLVYKLALRCRFLSLELHGQGVFRFQVPPSAVTPAGMIACGHLMACMCLGTANCKLL